MARTPATFPGGLRLSDYLSVGVIARIYPRAAVRDALQGTGRSSVRKRALPAEVMVYYVIAMALFRAVSTREVLRCLMQGLRWVSPELPVRVSGKSSISRARGASRQGAVCGAEGRLRAAACLAADAGCVVPGSAPSGVRRLDTGGARRGGEPGVVRASRVRARQRRLPEDASDGADGDRPRAPLAWCGGPLRESEMEQAERLIPHLSGGMLVLADRYYCGYPCGRGRLRPGRRFSGGSSRTRGSPSSRASVTGHG